MRRIITSDLGLRTTERLLCDTMTWEDCVDKGLDWVLKVRQALGQKSQVKRAFQMGHNGAKRAKSHISYDRGFLHLLTSGAAFLLEKNG